MQLARVIGSVVSTQIRAFKGLKLLMLFPLIWILCRAPFVTVNTVGAGEGEIIMGWWKFIPDTTSPWISILALWILLILPGNGYTTRDAQKNGNSMVAE